MDIRILELVEGAKEAGGLTVIIDVFRAFSLEAYLFARGARAVCAAGTIETALGFGREHPDYIKIGERGGKIQPGFDYGNSPSQTEHADFKGRTVIHTTSAGTQGLVNARGADELLVAGLVNAKATADLEGFVSCEDDGGMKGEKRTEDAVMSYAEMEKNVLRSRRIRKTDMREPIITIDLHGLTKEEAIRVIDRAIAKADQSTYRIRLIHGYHRGTVLKNVIQDTYRYEAKVKKVVPGDNMGITELVLRDW